MGRYLIYAPTPEPDYDDYWLLDIRLYSHTFRADRASIRKESVPEFRNPTVPVACATSLISGRETPATAWVTPRLVAHVQAPADPLRSPT
jgi:hypothetical protein